MTSTISIHPGASAVVCRHTLEVLISLAKPFSEHFLPWKEQSASASNTSSTASASSSSSSSLSKTVDFWDTLLKLDQMSNSNKKGKSVARSHSNVGSLKEASGASDAASGANTEDDQGQISFENTPFGQLLGMLSSPVIRRNSVLTDKLLRLLSLISIVQQPDIMAAAAAATGGSKAKTPENSSTSNIRLVTFYFFVFWPNIS